MKRAVFLLLVVAIALAPWLADHAVATSRVVTLSARLRGSSEPRGGAPHGGGTATIKLDEARHRVCATIRVWGIKLPARAAQIHLQRTRRTGRLILRLRPPGKSGKSQGCVSTPVSQIRAIEHHPSYYYVNVYTSDYPHGAVRGQL